MFCSLFFITVLSQCKYIFLQNPFSRLYTSVMAAADSVLYGSYDRHRF